MKIQRIARDLGIYAEDKDTDELLDEIQARIKPKIETNLILNK